jgi:hypothetical protein
MGSPSDKRRSARRPGKRERARVKTHHRCQGSGFVGGAVSYHVKAGRKKYRKVSRYVHNVVQAHLIGDSLTSKSVRVIERPLYKISLGPHLHGHSMEPRGVAIEHRN